MNWKDVVEGIATVVLIIILFITLVFAGVGVGESLNKPVSPNDEIFISTCVASGGDAVIKTTGNKTTYRCVDRLAK